MSEKSVDYSSITVNINTIYQKLHAVATEFAEKKNPAIKVENLGFTDAEDPKQAKFLGGGQYRIIGGMKDQSAETLPRKDFAEVFREYTSWFCGQEEASYIKEQMLAPIYRSEDAGSDENEVGSDSGVLSSDENRLSSDVDRPTDKEKVTESYRTDNERKLLNLLFEEKEGDGDKDGTRNGDGETEGGGRRKLIGYSIGYDVSINNRKDRGIKDAIANKTSGFFGQMLADLRNISITMNGGKLYNIGKWLDPAKWKEVPGFIDIDKNRVASNVKNALNHDFDSNDADVRCIGGKTLITYLNRKGKITPTIKTKIENAQYSVVIGVNAHDPNYPDYTQKSIAKSATKAFGTAKNLLNTNKVKEDDVIKIDNIESLYKRNSSYDEKSKYDVRDRASDGKTPTVSKTSSTPQTTKSASVPTRSTVTEDDEKKDTKKDDVEIKEDTKLEKLVKTDEYKDFVNKTLQEQCNLELNDEEHSCVYKSTEDIANDMMEKGVNDLDLLRKIKNAGAQSYYVTVTTNVKEAMDESLERQKDLLTKLFEDVGEIEDILEEEEETKKSKALDAAIDCINLTGDPKEDAKAKKNIKVGVRNVLKRDKVEAHVKSQTERAIKNTIIKTLDQFKTDRSFEDFDTDCFIASVNKRNLDESLADMVSEWLGRLSESVVPEGENGTRNEGELPQDIQSRNSKLVGKITNIVGKKSPGWHVDPYCALTYTGRVVEYMKKHNIGQESVYSEILKKKYCAIVLAKRNLEIDGRTVEGGSGNEEVTDSKVNQILDEVCGRDNKLPVINCKTQNRDTMDNVKGDLIARTLAFYSEKRKPTEKRPNPNYISDPSKRHVPELDVWLRPFDNTDHPTDPPTADTTVQWFIVLPDPIPIEPPKGKEGGDEVEHKNPDGVREDWYIIPHKRIKDLGDRPHQETHDAKGITRTKTSDDEYRA